MENQNQHVYFYGRTKGRVEAKYRFLSNFYMAPIIIDNKKYATVEHYFQAMKHKGTELEEKIRLASSPGNAKKLAWQKEPPSNWEEIKDDVMLKALRAKFTQNSNLKQKLLDTGTAQLHEDSPTDKYWGFKGLDKLGKLLMIVREEITKDNVLWFSTI